MTHAPEFCKTRIPKTLSNKGLSDGRCTDVTVRDNCNRRKELRRSYEYITGRLEEEN